MSDPILRTLVFVFMTWVTPLSAQGDPEPPVQDQGADSPVEEREAPPGQAELEATPNASEPQAADRWALSFTPHFWFPGQSGNATVNGVRSDVGMTIGEAIEATNWAVFLHGEARKGKLAFSPYFMATQLEDDDSLADTETTSLLTDFVVSYEVHEREVGPDQAQKLTIDLWGGLRYQYLKVDIDAGVANVEESHDWVEPVVGGGVTIQVAENFRWQALRLGFSGFGIGSASNLTTSVYSGVTWGLGTDKHLVFGYRALNIDYSRGSGADRFSQDILIHGPIVGVQFEF